MGTVSCRKSGIEQNTVFVDLWFVSVNTSKNVSAGQDIISQVTCSGSDLCYRFSHFEIKEPYPREFYITAKATYPNPKKGDIVCLQTIYNKDTSVSIPASAAGKYVLHFLNDDEVIKTDTVQVN